MGPSALLSQANDICPSFKDRLDKEIKLLNGLSQSYQELNEKFEQSVEADFTAQAEGFIDSIRRNEAVKLAFARKKLGATLDLKKEQVKQLRGNYCVKCTEKNSLDRAGRCERCPDDKVCQQE